MSQPTSIQMLDTAIWKELGVEEVTESEAFYHALATLLSRWLLARSEYPEMEAIKLLAKVRAYVAQPCQTQSYLRIDQRYLRMTQNPL